MDITVISRMDWKHSNAGGAERYLREVLERLADSHEITLLCSQGEGLPTEEQTDGIRIRRCGIQTNNAPYTNQLFIAYRYYRERVDDDVLIVNGASQLYPLFRTDRRIDIYHLFGGRESWDGDLSEKVRFLLEWVAMRLPKGTQIAVSENQREKIERETPHIIDSVVNGGVNLEKFEGDVEKFDSPTILHLGRLGRQKGTDVAIDIHKEIQRRLDIDIDFHICGTGEMSELADEYATNSDCVTYHGYVSEEKKVELMQKSWLKLMPSRSEAFPLVVMEANAAGTPVVGSDITGLSNSIETGINGFQVANEEMASKCIKIICNADHRTTLYESSRKYAENFSWEKTSMKIASEVQSNCS